MRSLILAILTAGSLGFVATAALSAPMTSIHVRDGAMQRNLLERVQSRRYCAKLRRACEFKNERGEVGEGNCRRYRRECGRRY
jgi:hypothetical protein